MVRYADDFVILCRSQRGSRGALEQVRQWTAQAGLTLHPIKTRIVDATERGGFDFLGYHFERGLRWPRGKPGQVEGHDTSKTRRTNGHSLQAIIEDVNRTLRGWFEYFKHSHQTTFPGRWMDAEAAPEHPAETAEAKRPWPGRDHHAGQIPSLPSMGCSLL